PKSLIDLFRNAGILIEFFEDVNVEIWKKYIFIAPFALVTAAYGRTIGEAAHDQHLGSLVRSIMQEIKAIADTLAINLPHDIVETSVLKAGQFPFETKTSFQRDVETKGRQSEWDLFGGTVIRYAEKLGLPADNTRATLDRLLKIIEPS
ncbi:MAG: ketopantoate reductase C-terminal domain-containing protein, partial [Syntrophaceae bacterium]